MSVNRTPLTQPRERRLARRVRCGRNQAMLRGPSIATFIVVAVLAACSDATPTVSPRPSSVDGTYPSSSPGPSSPSPTILPKVTAGPLPGGAATCENPDDGYSISYPAGWIVHPGDPEQGVGPCSRFGPEPFDLTYTADSVSPTIRVITYAGRCLAFDLIDLPDDDDVEDVTVAGYPAIRYTTPRGSFAYILNLRPDAGRIIVDPRDDPPSSDGCDGADALLIGGQSETMDSDELRAVVDAMAVSIRVNDPAAGLVAITDADRQLFVFGAGPGCYSLHVTSGEYMTLRPPAGWTIETMDGTCRGRRTIGAIVALRDDAGNVVARPGDLVQVTGEIVSQGENEFAPVFAASAIAPGADDIDDALTLAYREPLGTRGLPNVAARSVLVACGIGVLDMRVSAAESDDNSVAATIASCASDARQRGEGAEWIIGQLTMDSGITTVIRRILPDGTGEIYRLNRNPLNTPETWLFERCKEVLESTSEGRVLEFNFIGCAEEWVASTTGA
jgi:hypothetical protein